MIRLKNLLDELEKEYAKFEDGNKSAGVRSRKILMDIKKTAQELREKINSKKEKQTVPAPEPEQVKPEPVVEQTSTELPEQTEAKSEPETSSVPETPSAPETSSEAQEPVA